MMNPNVEKITGKRFPVEFVPGPRWGRLAVTTGLNLAADLHGIGATSLKVFYDPDADFQHDTFVFGGRDIDVRSPLRGQHKSFQVAENGDWSNAKTFNWHATVKDFFLRKAAGNPSA